MTKEPAVPQGSSKKAKSGSDAGYSSKLGPIPDDHFENEPTPTGLKGISKEDLAAFDAKTKELMKKYAKK